MGNRPTRVLHPGSRAGTIRRSAIAVGVIATLLFPSLSSAAPAAPVITAPAADAIVAGASPTKVSIRGTAASGTSIEVLDAGVSLGTTSTGTDGTWRLDVSLADGAHTLTAIATDGGGVASPPSSPVSFTVDAIVPDVAISAPETAHVFGAGETPTVEGTASDERTIHAIRLEYWQLGKLQFARLATCDACDEASSTAWHHLPALPTAGHWEVRAYSYDAAGNRSSVSITSFVASGLPGSPISPPELPELPGVPTIVDPDPGETLPGGENGITFGGTTEPGSIVEVHEEVEGLGTIGATVDSDHDGQWTVRVSLADGTYGVRVQATDADGNVSELSELITFDVDATVPQVLDLPTSTMTFLPLQPVVIEGRVADERRAVAVVLEYWLLDELVLRDVASCPACPTQEAVWASRPQLADPGYYHVKVRAFDAAGNSSSIATVTFVKTV